MQRCERKKPHIRQIVGIFARINWTWLCKPLIQRGHVCPSVCENVYFSPEQKGEGRGNGKEKPSEAKSQCCRDIAVREEIVYAVALPLCIYHLGAIPGVQW